MIEISLLIEGQMGLTWPLWKRWVAMADSSGFAGLYRSDHFTMMAPPDNDSLECFISLAYQADHSRNIVFGPMVAPLSFRDPVMLARQGAALDDLSGGRLVLGVGAGWLAREHELFGYPLGDLNSRYARWEEGLEVVTRLLRQDAPVTFEGEYYRLQEASLLPRPQRPGGPQILVGGSGRQRTVSLAARYADVWNITSISPEDFRETSRRLDGYLQQAGRDPGSVKRTVAALGFCGHSEEALDRRLAVPRSWDPDLAGLDNMAAAQVLRQEWGAVAGLPEAVIEQIRAYQAAGVQELVLQWFDLEDVAGAEALSEQVLSKL